MSNGPRPKYQRVLLKISGEALMGNSHHAISPQVLDRLAHEIVEVYAMGVELALVIGAGNYFRGAALSAAGINRITGDHMGMLATIINAIALRDAFEKAGLSVRVLSALPVAGIVDVFDRLKAIHHLRKKRIVILSGGTGNPLVTTDSAASLRGIEIQADIVLKATNVDGVYSADPAVDPHAQFYEQLTYQEALEKELAVMDLSAFCQCRDHNMPLRVFNIHKQGALCRVILGEREGTLVSRGEE